MFNVSSYLRKQRNFLKNMKNCGIKICVMKNIWKPNLIQMTKLLLNKTIENPMIAIVVKVVFMKIINIIHKFFRSMSV